MKKKIVWMLVSGLMVLSLVIASCAPKEEAKKAEEEAATVTTEMEEEEAVEEEEEAVSPDVPKYGGTLVILAGSDISVWNPGAVAGRGAAQDGIVLEQILGVDWTKGPAGTGETNFIGGVTDFKYVVGNLAESWETPEVGVWILNIRKGVHWAYHPNQAASRLVNGREMTAEDIAYSIEYMRDNPTSSTSLSEPTLIKNTTVERTGQWQLTVRTPVAPTTGYLWIMGGGGVQYVWPKEFLQKYATSNNWYDVVGTGPYILDDYVGGSVARYIRNPNYWTTNPCGPGKGDQLPYPDRINYQIIPDFSTRLAALRTGKADLSSVDTLTWEDAESLLGTNPNLKSAQTIVAPLQVSGRVDIPEQPFSKKKVRQAMMMAIDRETIIRDLYEGHAEILDSPARKWYTSIYTPLEELPESTQELYEYHPDRAKQLLTEAGYPDGFRAKLVLMNTTTSVASAEIIKEMWAKVDINIDLQVVEPNIFIGLWAGFKTEDMMLSSWPGGDGSLFVRYSMGYFRGPNIFNMSHVNNPPGTDPIIEAAYEKQCEYVMVNYPAADAATKEAYKYCLGEAFLIPMPAPHGFQVWQPWVKDYHGESSMAFKFWLRYVWLDQDLKESMGY